MRRVAIVTGGNRGLGLAFTEELVKNNYVVYILSRTIGDLAEIEGENKDWFHLSCDVSDAESVHYAVGWILSETGRIDLLINNAIRFQYRSFFEMSIEEYERDMKVNFSGYLNPIFAVVPIFEEQGKGVIMNIGSAVTFTGLEGMSSYTSSKAAVEALSYSIMDELAKKNIRVIVAHPPMMDTLSGEKFDFPDDWKDDPRKVAQKLLKKMNGKRDIISTDWRISVFQIFGRMYPKWTRKQFMRFVYMFKVIKRFVLRSSEVEEESKI